MDVSPETVQRGAYAAGITGALSLFVAACLYYLYRDLTTPTVVFLVVGVVGTAAYLWLDQAALQEASQSRGVVYGSSAALILLMAGGVGVVAYAVVEQHDKSWDLTQKKSFTLSDQTVRVLEGLDRDVEVLAFFKHGTKPEKDLSSLTRRMVEHTDHLKVQFIDPLRQPSLAEQHEVTDAETVILKAGEKERRIEYGSDEAKLIQELVVLLSAEEHRICWSMGHGEPDPDDTRTEMGFGGIVSELEKLNYTVTKTYLMTEGVDRACDALVIITPALGFYAWEHEAVAAYVAEGGRLLVAVDVDEYAALYAPDTSPISLELERYGVKAGSDLVIDVDPRSRIAGMDEPTFPVLQDASFQSHPIAKTLAGAVVLGLARTVSPVYEREGVSLTIVAESSSEAWAEGDLETQPFAYEEGTERLGNLPLVVAVEVTDPAKLEVAPPSPEEADVGARVLDFLSAQYGQSVTRETALRADLGAGDMDVRASLAGMSELLGVTFADDLDLSALVTAGDLIDAAKRAQHSGVDVTGNVSRAVPGDFAPKAGGRLVVFGDATFASNTLLDLGVNRDLFLNGVAWLVDEEDQIGQRPPEGEKLAITALGEAFLCLLSFVIVPGAMVSAAVVVGLRRRFSR